MLIVLVSSGTLICSSVSDTSGIRIEYLPAYSPDLNPIEEAFSKIKAFIQQNNDIFLASELNGQIFDLYSRGQAKPTNLVSRPKIYLWLGFLRILVPIHNIQFYRHFLEYSHDKLRMPKISAQKLQHL